MIFVALALLCSRPIHKEAEVVMDHCDGHDHVRKDAESGDARQKSKHKPQATKEFCGDGQERE